MTKCQQPITDRWAGSKGLLDAATRGAGEKYEKAEVEDTSSGRVARINAKA
jgi:hypothetical protein